jgi:hypothetical protein
MITRTPFISPPLVKWSFICLDPFAVCDIQLKSGKIAKVVLCLPILCFLL